MDKLKRVSLTMELMRLQEAFPDAIAKLQDAGYHFEECQYPDGFSLHGDVENTGSVFRKIIVADTSDQHGPLFPSFTISAVISDVTSVPELNGHAAVFSTQLFLGEKRNLYTEHMQEIDKVDPQDVERIFVTTSLIMQGKP